MNGRFYTASVGKRLREFTQGMSAFAMIIPTVEHPDCPTYRSLEASGGFARISSSSDSICRIFVCCFVRLIAQTLEEKPAPRRQRMSDSLILD